MKPDPYAGIKYGLEGRLIVREIDDEMVEIVAYYTEHFIPLDPEDTRREIHDLLVRAERALREALEDWLRRYTLEGSEHRLHRRWIKNMQLPEKIDFDPVDNYAALKRGWLKDIAEQQKEWIKEWLRDYARPHAKSNPRKFQDGSGLAKPPLVAVYHVVNEWFVRVVKQPFCPTFADDGNEGNEAADVFSAVAEVLGHRYTPIHCKWVHGKHYRDLKIRY